VITDDLIKEAVFKAVRSGGKGGQNVNKVSTKVELYFDVRASGFLTDEQKSLILGKLKNYADKDGILKLSSQSERPQIMNKNKVKKKFAELIAKAFRKEKKRGKTSPTAASRIDRLNSKKIVSAKKTFRRKDFEFDE